MPQEHSWDTRETAENLYIIGGHTYAQVAAQTGVSVSQIQRWSDDGNWRERRREYRQAHTLIRENVVKAQLSLIQDVLETKDPQKAYAFSSIVTSGKGLAQATAEQAQEAAPAREINTRADADAALKEAVLLKVNKLLAAPDGVTRKGITELAELLDWLMPGANGDDRGSGKELSEETKQRIRMLYGVK